MLRLEMRFRGHRPFSAGGVLTFSALLIVAAPGAAQAATVEAGVRADGGVVRFIAAAGEANDVVVSSTTDEVIVVDRRATTVAAGDCRGGGPPGTPVICPVPENARAVEVKLGDRADALDTTAVGPPIGILSVEARAGDDRVLGGDVAMSVEPGDGADDVTTGRGDDEWRQEGRRPEGNDRFDAGAGRDIVQYWTDYGVRVRLDGIANDGGRREHDNLIGVEAVYGTGKTDFLEGNGSDNYLGDGDLGDSNDRLAGLAGDDRLFAVWGDDRLLGGRGGDSLVGGPGRDVLHGGRGDDLINAKRATVSEPSGTDRVDCGPGKDTAVVARRDRVRNCETVRRYP